MRAAIACPLLVVASFVVPAGALAQQSVDALIDRGVSLRERGDDAGALALFEQAYRVAPTPRAAAQRGLAEQALGRWVDANTHIEEALAATRDAWVLHNRAALVASLEVVHRHVGRLEIAGGVAGASVRYGSRLLGRLPLARAQTVLVGRATLRVEAPGFEAFETVVEIRPGQTSRERVDLVPGGSDADVGEAAPRGRRRAQAQGGGVLGAWWFWAAVGVLVVGGATAAVVAATRDPGVESPVPGTAGVVEALGARF